MKGIEIIPHKGTIEPNTEEKLQIQVDRVLFDKKLQEEQNIKMKGLIYCSEIEKNVQYSAPTTIDIELT
eukprot:UN29598